MSEHAEMNEAVPRVPVADASTSFERFYDGERARLFQALVVITGNRSEAEDISQEAFLRTWERWERIRSLEDPAGYLHRTAMNAFRDRLRRSKLSLARAMRPLPRSSDLDAVEARSVMTAVLGTLAPRQRAALVLTEGLGYSAEEAGEFLGIKGSTVRALHHQARAALSKTAEAFDG